MKKSLGIGILMGLLTVSVAAFGQDESALTAEEMTDPLAAIASLYSMRALEDILLTVIILVVAPIIVFALYNRYNLKAVLDANQQIEGDKRKPVTTLLKAITPPEPLGLPNGSVRAIIAIVGISIFAYAIFAFPDFRKDLLTALISLLSAIIGFYFGARATEELREPEEETEKPKE